MMLAIAKAMLLVGSFLTVLAGVGIVRLPDVFIRMHAATKVGTLGTGLIIAGVGIYFGDDPSVVIRCVLIVLFLLLTAPIGAHMIGRAALRSGITPWQPPSRAKPVPEKK